MRQNKKRYGICMHKTTHDKLAKFAKKNGYPSLSDFLASIGIEEMARVKKGKNE